MHVRYTLVYTVLQLGRSRVHARVLHYEPWWSCPSDGTQVSDLVTGSTSIGSESGVQSLLDRLNEETHDKRIIFSENLSISGHLLGIII